jgi:hypothetical protein
MVDSSKIGGFGQSFQQQADILKGDEDQATEKEADQVGWFASLDKQFTGQKTAADER